MEYRKDLPPLPNRMRSLPVSDRGYPVPFFVAWLDGAGNAAKRGAPGAHPDFRMVLEGMPWLCHSRRLCWICGERLGTFRAFTIGPVCAVNRTSPEPPSHAECATFAACACPFLVNPKERRQPDHPDQLPPAGFMIKRNPGVALVWVTKRYQVFRPDMRSPGILFDVGEPEWVAWYAEGRPATRVEVLASIDSGMPLLREAAAPDGPAGLAELDRRYALLAPLLPKEGP